MGEEPPRKDDLTVCLACGGILKFTADLTVAKLDEGEIFEIIQKDLEAYMALVEAQKTVLQMNALERSLNV